MLHSVLQRTPKKRKEGKKRGWYCNKHAHLELRRLNLTRRIEKKKIRG